VIARLASARDRQAAASLLRAWASQPAHVDSVITLPGPWTGPQRAVALELMIDATRRRRR
jgi:hypothetical protein